MLPCGRYYYEPEGGYVGNPWVKFSFQYIYLYLAWILHHLELIDQWVFHYSYVFYINSYKLYNETVIHNSYQLFNYNKFNYKLNNISLV